MLQDPGHRRWAVYARGHRASSARAACTSPNYIPTSSTDDSIINQSSDTPTKYMDYLFERQSGSWYLTGPTESETKPDSTASTEAASQPQPMAESDVQDAILATAGLEVRC